MALVVTGFGHPGVYWISPQMKFSGHPPFLYGIIRNIGTGYSVRNTQLTHANCGLIQNKNLGDAEMAHDRHELVSDVDALLRYAAEAPTAIAGRREEADETLLREPVKLQ